MEKTISYSDLLSNPPKIVVNENSREVIFTMISCMCDNISYLNFKKNSDGDFKIIHYNDKCALSTSNLQMKHNIDDICWSADSGDWNTVVDMINSGTSKVSSVKSR